MNRQKQLDDSYKIAAFCFFAIIIIAFLSTFFGCTAQPFEPEEKSLSGVYQSVPYETYKTFDIKLEVLQNGNDLIGTVVKDGQKNPIWGTVKDYQVLIDGGFFNLNLAYNENKPYPFAGNCTWDGTQRAIRFEKTEELHNQGGVQ